MAFKIFLHLTLAVISCYGVPQPNGSPIQDDPGALSPVNIEDDRGFSNGHGQGGIRPLPPQSPGNGFEYGPTDYEAIDQGGRKGFRPRPNYGLGTGYGSVGYWPLIHGHHNQGGSDQSSEEKYGLSTDKVSANSAFNNGKAQGVMGPIQHQIPGYGLEYDIGGNGPFNYVQGVHMSGFSQNSNKHGSPGISYGQGGLGPMPYDSPANGFQYDFSGNIPFSHGPGSYNQGGYSHYGFGQGYYGHVFGQDNYGLGGFGQGFHGQGGLSKGNSFGGFGQFNHGYNAFNQGSGMGSFEQGEHGHNGFNQGNNMGVFGQENHGHNGFKPGSGMVFFGPHNQGHNGFNQGIGIGGFGQGNHGHAAFDHSNGFGGFVQDSHGHGGLSQGNGIFGFGQNSHIQNNFGQGINQKESSEHSGSEESTHDITDFKPSEDNQVYGLQSSSDEPTVSM